MVSFGDSALSVLVPIPEDILRWHAAQRTPAITRRDAVAFSYPFAPYARVQKSVNTFGGSGESIMRCVKRMPIIPSAGSVYADVPKPPVQPNRPGVWKISLRRMSTAIPKPQHTAEAHAVGQQIANDDRAQRRHRVIDIRGDGFEHVTICKFRQPRLDRVVEP